MEKMNDGYDGLRQIVLDAVGRAAIGKGKERHASGEDFEDQQICQIPRWQKSIHGLLFQVTKKAMEIERLPTLEAQIKELQDIIIYSAAAIIVKHEELGKAYQQNIQQNIYQKASDFIDENTVSQTISPTNIGKDYQQNIYQKASQTIYQKASDLVDENTNIPVSQTISPTNIGSIDVDAVQDIIGKTN